MTAGQLQAAVLRAGSKCKQSLCSAVRVACRFPSCYEWTPALPLSILFSSSHVFCVYFTACKQWEEGQQCKSGDGRVTQRYESRSSSLRPLEIHVLCFHYCLSVQTHCSSNPLTTSKTFCCCIPSPHTLSSCP